MALGTIDDRQEMRTPDPDTDPVCEFYTAHPYPPPVANLDRVRDEWRDANRHRAEHHLLWPDRPYRDDLDILVAGCGTWQAAKYAVCRPRSHVVGIDVSTTSLEYTDQLRRKYALTNLTTAHLSIECVETMGQRFDLIVCTGVLHHLVDPVAGLRALRAVLKPDGVLYLMVYAPYGRTGIYMLQEYCRRLGVGRSHGEVADLRATVAALPPQHPLHTELATSRDAQNADALADALLNPRDRSYSVAELFDFLEKGGVAFRRWYWQAPYLPQCGAFAATTHASRVARLRPHEQYAAMELWRGTMGTHSVVAARDDIRDDAEVNVHFNDQRWSGFVPIRLPYTMCVEERLPQGAAAVLLNRSHQHRDLLMTITAPEKRMFDAIDGQQTIAEIAVETGLDSAADFVKTFVEKLWRYDQVVFDTSGATRPRDLRRVGHEFRRSNMP